MLVRKYFIRDIKNYEDETGISVLDLFRDPSITNIVQLIMLGNKGCDVEQAFNVLDNYLENNSMTEAYSEIKDVLFGETVESEDESSIDGSKYKYLTDIYSIFCGNLMSMGLAYSEFWTLDSKEMYKLFDSLSCKAKNDMKMRLHEQFIGAKMTGAAAWGQLEDEPDWFGDNLKDRYEALGIENADEYDEETLGNLAALLSRRAALEKGAVKK